MGDAARHAAFLAIARQCKRFPEFDLQAMESILRSDEASGAPAPGVGGLSGLDRAFAHAIHDAVIARWLTLEFLISLYCARPLSQVEPRVRAAMHGGAAQLVFMDRVPAHAAINHAVEWAKAVANPGAAGLVNAVLRRVARLVARDEPSEESRVRRGSYTDRRDELPIMVGGTGLGGASLESNVLVAQILPEDPVDRLCIATSHPKALVEPWLKGYSMREVRRRCLHTLLDPPIVVNVTSACAPLPVCLSPHDVPGHAVFRGSRTELVAMLEERSDLWVQDAASSNAVASIAHLRPSLILDLCAGQGTKTRQLAATFPNAQIVATDIDAGRFEVLQRTFAGSANSGGQVRIVDHPRIRDDFAAKADLILLDVPCSNTGVLARRPEARYRFGAKSVDSLANAQRQIIADAIPLLAERPRGRILYSTCSLERQENQDQAAWAAKWHGFKPTHESQTLPGGVAGDPPMPSPPTAYRDGAYSVLLGT